MFVSEIVIFFHTNLGCWRHFVDQHNTQEAKHGTVDTNHEIGSGANQLHNSGSSRLVRNGIAQTGDLPRGLRNL